MKKKIIIIFLIVLILLTVGYELFILLKNNDPEPIVDDVITNKDDFIYIGSFYDEFVKEENYVFTNYEDFNIKFQSNVLKEEDFIKNNFVLLNIMYDECSDRDVTPVSYKIDGNNIYATFNYTAGCGICAPQHMYYLLKVDKSINNVSVNIDYKATNKPYCNPNVTYKPLIYIYPTHDMNVRIKLGNEHLLTTTYPKYNNGWNMYAKVNGDLIDEYGKVYYGLYWEGLNHISNNYADGFVVKKEDTIKFLEEKLSILGLNERESNEFIIYWLPKLEESEYNLIRFESIEKINEQMPLIVNPTPDTIIRVLMEYKPLNKKINIDEQELTKVERKGFTVVEWGGSQIN